MDYLDISKLIIVRGFSNNEKEPIILFQIFGRTEHVENHVKSPRFKYPTNNELVYLFKFRTVQNMSLKKK